LCCEIKKKDCPFTFQNEYHICLWLIIFDKPLVLFVFYLQIRGKNMFNFAAIIEIAIQLIVYTVFSVIERLTAFLGNEIDLCENRKY